MFLHRQVIRTPGRFYSAQFDLMKDVKVRVYTVLRGLCTNGTTLMSSHYAEVVQKPSNTGQTVRWKNQDVATIFTHFEKKKKNQVFFFCPAGLKNTRVKDFNCVFYNMENMECSWRSQKAKKAISKQHLYFWYVQKMLQKTKNSLCTKKIPWKSTRQNVAKSICDEVK